jgi:hypothetical protein
MFLESIVPIVVESGIHARAAFYLNPSIALVGRARSVLASNHEPALLHLQLHVDFTMPHAVDPQCANAALRLVREDLELVSISPWVEKQPVETMRPVVSRPIFELDLPSHRHAVVDCLALQCFEHLLRRCLGDSSAVKAAGPA